ncbi:MAG TPA: hypothetical protein VG754_08580 [Verrucomicrobiae bacterium]|nr:hypothetical protein [Verrucomicrobiae bacterium]
MKTRISNLMVLFLALCAFVCGTVRVNSQVLVTVDPNQNWIGYMNVFQLPADGGAYEFGSTWGTADLRGVFGTTNLVLSPCTNVWETQDTAWVKADGMTPNDNMDANFYVQNDSLANTNLIFVGKCVSNTITNAPEPLTGVSYTSVAFIKIFDSGYGLLGSATSNLVGGQSFSISMDTTGAAHVQYGFETIGPDANPATVTNLGNVVIANAAPSKIVTVDPSQNWIGYMNVFALPATGGGYQFGSAWGTGALQAAFSGTNFLTLAPDTNVWETNDTYWVQADGVTPNKNMDASMYVQNDNLVNTNLVLLGTCLTNTLSAAPEPHTGISYTSVAFIKTFDGSFNLLGSAASPLLAAGQPFAISLNTTGATHVQYGFETIGPDASPATASSLGDVVLAAQAPPAAPVVPTNNAPTPSHPANKVLSMYNSSGVYTNHPIERWLAGWSGAGENLYTISPTGRVVLKYSNLQYAGVEFYNNDPTLGAGGDNVGGPTNYAINATGYDTFHVDVWTPDANQLGIQLVSINPTEAAQVDYLPASGVITNDGWISFDIPLSTFQANNPNTDFTDLQQMLWIDNQAGGGYTGGTFYIDNVYFYSSTSVTRPTLAATVSGGIIQLSFPTQNGFNYTVQYRTNLTDSGWQTLSTVSGNGSTQSIPDSANQKSRFYRLYIH